MRLTTIVATLVACLIGTNAMAGDYKVGTIEIMTPWSRATPKGAPTAIGYMSIQNNGTAPDRLIGGSVEVAKEFQLHAMAMEDGVAKMREFKAVDIGPQQKIEFKPGGSPVMFVGLKQPLHEGEHVKGTLTFEHAGTVQIEYDAQGIGAQTGPMNMDHMTH